MPNAQSLVDRIRELSHAVDWWNAAIIWALVLGAIAAVAVVLATRMALKRTGELAAVQEERIAGLQLDVAKQQERAANAEATLLSLQKGNLPRMLHFDSQDSINAMVASLKKQPIATEIMYKRDDSEAYSLASQIWGLLLSAGWNVSKPAPIPETITADKVLEDLGAQPLGVSIAIKAIPSNPKNDDPYSVLMGILAKTLGQVSMGRVPILPDGMVKIVVMPKP